jgi:pyruvate dehydrogenase E1 component
MSWLNDILDNDRDPNETKEWLESLKAVLDHDGPERAHELLDPPRRRPAALPADHRIRQFHSRPPGAAAAG